MSWIPYLISVVMRRVQGSLREVWKRGGRRDNDGSECKRAARQAGYLPDDILPYTRMNPFLAVVETTELFNWPFYIVLPSILRRGVGSASLILHPTFSWPLGKLDMKKGPQNMN